MPRIRRKRAAKRRVRVRWGRATKARVSDHLLHARFNRFRAEMDAAGSASARRIVLRRWWGEAFDGEEPDFGVWITLLELRMGYELIRRSYKDAEVKLPPRLRRRWKASKRLKIEAYDDRLAAILTAAATKETKVMAKKATSKKKTTKAKATKGAQGESQSAMARDIFSRRGKAPTRKSVIDEMTKRGRPEANIEGNLAWYVSQFNRGQLAGQEGEPSKPFKFADAPAKPGPKGGKKAAATKTTKKKTVRRRKAS